MAAATCRSFLSVLDEKGWCADFLDASVFTLEDINRHFRAGDAGPCQLQMRRGWNFSEEKFIRHVQWLRIDEAVYLRSTCLPSMKSGHYRQLVMLAGDRVQVLQAFCECTAGVSETCQHVAALLFAVVELKSPSSMDQQCTWVVPYKGNNRPPPMPLQEIPFWKVRTGKHKTEKKQRQRLCSLSPQTIDVTILATHLENNEPDIMWLRYGRRLPDEDDIFNSQGTESNENIPDEFVPTLPDSVDLSSPESRKLFKEYVAQMQPRTAEEWEDIRWRTMGQAGNSAWFAEREGRITASLFKRAIHCRKPESILKEICQYKEQRPLSKTDPRFYRKQMDHWPFRGT